MRPFSLIFFLFLRKRLQFLVNLTIFVFSRKSALLIKTIAKVTRKKIMDLRKNDMFVERSILLSLCTSAIHFKTVLLTKALRINGAS